MVLDEIKRLLGLRKLIVIPTDPWDVTGHTDGTARIIDENRVLVNDTSGMLKAGQNNSSQMEYEKYVRWIDHLQHTLTSAGFKIEDLPCSTDPNGNAASAWGVYLNFLRLDDMIIMPWFDGEGKNNKNAQSQLFELYNRPVYGVYADELSDWGGIINCCTWQHYA